MPGVHLVYIVASSGDISLDCISSLHIHHWMTWCEGHYQSTIKKAYQSIMY